MALRGIRAELKKLEREIYKSRKDARIYNTDKSETYSGTRKRIISNKTETRLWHRKD